VIVLRMNQDVLGWRRLFGALGPSTNTVVQPDFDDLRPPGITNHYSRIYTPNAKALDDASAMAATQVIAGNVIDAVRSVMTCEPDYLVMGMSAITFFGGGKGADEFQRSIERESGVGVSIGSHACAAALKAYGSVRRIAFFSPYYPVSNAEVRSYFTDMGFEVVRDIPLRATSWTGIAQIRPERVIETLHNLDGPDVDAIVQVGTNLSCIRIAAAAELLLGKPVIAINTATYWHALRANHIKDRIYGFGRLLEDF
jgi:maleate isomerase